MSYEDTDVTPGATYDYRLGIPVATGGEIYVGDTRVLVPSSGPKVLALSRVMWDGSAGALAMQLSLPSGTGPMSSLPESAAMKSGPAATPR